MMLPSFERVDELLQYDPETGKIYWKCYRNSQAVAGQEAGSINANGYLVIGIDKAIIPAHRVIWLLQTGNWPSGQIDHADHCRINNKWSNLFDVSQRSNTLNRKKSKRNSSKHTGIYQKSVGSWIARICVNRKMINLGTFSSIEEAVSARSLAEIKHGFHPNHGK